MFILCNLSLDYALSYSNKLNNFQPVNVTGYFIGTRVLMSAGLACVGIAVICHVVWACSSKHTAANTARKATIIFMILGGKAPFFLDKQIKQFQKLLSSFKNY